MKWRSIIVSCLLCVALRPLQAQQANADTLLALEAHYFYAKDSLQKENYLLQKCNVHMQQQLVTEACLRDLERINESRLNTEQLANLCWNKALCNYILEHPQTALHHIKRYQTLSADTSVQTQLVLALCLKEIDTTAFRQQIMRLANYDVVFLDLQSFIHLANYEKKHRKAYLLASALVPGAGSVALGYPVKGLTSTAVNAAVVYAIIQLSKHNLYANAILWGTGFGLKFYLGNIALTDKLFTKRERSKVLKLETTCKQAVSDLIKKYPLALKAVPLTAMH